MDTLDYTTIYKRTEQYVTGLFEEKLPAHLVFHNLEHTKNVVARANEISGHYQLSEKDMLIVFIAAWFHDTGYLFSGPVNHETKSVEVMNEFVKKFDIEEDIPDEAGGCIMATSHPRNPTNLLQEILCDADTYHFGTKDFKETNKLAFTETHTLNQGNISKTEFDEATLLMLRHHQFYTSYCRELLSDYKKKNMKKLKKKSEKLQEEEIQEVKEVKEQERADIINEKQGTTKGMQTMLRLTSSNHIQLSEMADSKANILISVNAIIISVILSVLLRKLQTDPYLTIPTIIFLAFSVVTIVISILATRPKLNSGRFEDEDVLNKKTNLLFFGNFHKMEPGQYESAMRTMMKDPDYLYSSIIQDIYHLGAVLGKKYKLIRLAYNVFMFGIIISVIAFGVASMMNTAPPPTAVTNSTGSPF